jgi:PHP domain/PHP-associated
MTPFKLLFHVHTSASFDSTMSPRTIMRYCRDHGINAVAICDHDSIRGAREARRWAAAYQVIVIPGVEVATDAGDIIGLFVDRRPSSLDAADVVQFIKDECNGLAVLPHPARGHDLERIPLADIDIVETGNARCSAADNDFADALARRLRKPTIVGADAHFASELPNALCTYSGPALADIHVESANSELRAMFMDGPCTTYLQRSPARYSALSRIVKGVKRRRLGTFLGGCQTLLREETNRRLWRFSASAKAR